MGREGRTVEQVLARLGGRAHGVVTRKELRAEHVSAREIDRRVEKGALLVEYRGVYRVGHAAPNREARYLAAVRAGGDGAVLSGRAAAHLHGILKGPAPPPGVTAPTERRIKGVKTRHCRHLNARDLTTVRGIPVTTVARTLVDLAAEHRVDDLARLCHEAGVLHRTTPKQVEAVLARRPNSPGAGKLRAIMRGDVRVVLSKLESRFLQLLRENGLPLPETNRPAGGRRVDCRWPAHRLTVELDSYAFHGSRHAWERDHRRAREAYAREDDFRHYTYGDVMEHPRLMLRELRGLLGRRPA
jgi:hypothetical protein